MGRNAQGILDEAGVLQEIIQSLERADASIASNYRHQPTCEMIGIVRNNLMRERAGVLDALTAVAGAGDPFVVARLQGGHSKQVAVALFEAVRAEALNPPPPMTEERKARLAREIEELEAKEAAAAEAPEVRTLVAGMEILGEAGFVKGGEGVPVARLLRAMAESRGERPRVVLRVVDPARADA